MSGYNLPDGVTPRDIDRAFGDESDCCPVCRQLRSECLCQRDDAPDPLDTRTPTDQETPQLTDEVTFRTGRKVGRTIYRHFQGDDVGELVGVMDTRELAARAVKALNAHRDLVNALLSAHHALKSYEFGNRATDLARNTAAACGEALKRAGEDVSKFPK